MTVADFDYVAATSVEEAARKLGGRGERVLLAGGQALLTELKLGRVRPAMVVDIGRVRGLDTITAAGGGLRVGATVTIDALSRSGQLSSGPGALADAVAVIGDPQVRNRATVGGGIANRTAGADLPAVALACGAAFDVAGAKATRTLAADEMFGPSGIKLRKSDIIAAIDFPARGGSAYEKLANPGSGYAICGVAALVVTGASGVVEECRVAVTGATAVPVRLPAVEAALTGTSASTDDIAGAAGKATARRLPYLSDVAAPAEYRAHLTEVLAARALTRAVDRARRANA